MDDNLITDLTKLIHGLAGKICREYGWWDYYNGMVEAGEFAAKKAAINFDPAKGAKLTTFAFKPIRGAMFDYVRENQLKGIQVSRTDWELTKKVRRAHDELMKRLERQPTVREIAGHLGVEEKLVDDALELLALSFESLDMAEREDDQETALELPAGGLTPEAKAILNQAIRELPENYRAVVILRDIGGFSVRETAEQLKMPPGTVQSDLFRAHRMLRMALQPIMNGGENYA